MATTAQRLGFLAKVKQALPASVVKEIDLHASTGTALLEVERITAEAFVRTLPRGSNEFTKLPPERAAALEALDGISWDSALFPIDWVATFIEPGLVVPQDERPTTRSEYFKLADLAKGTIVTRRWNSTEPPKPDPAATRLLDRLDADPTFDSEDPQKMPLFPLRPDGRLAGTP